MLPMEKKRFLFLCILIVSMMSVYDIFGFEYLIPANTLKRFFGSQGKQRIDFNRSSVSTDPKVQPDNSNNRLDIYVTRRQLAEQGCDKINRTIYDSINVRNNIKIDPVHNIRYCPIPKVGTTFWVRTMTVLSSKGRLKSPFEIGRGQADLIFWTHLPDEEKRVYASGGQSFTFVRDPYARIFSGYENKFYLVNPTFWKSYGREIVQIIRGQNDAEHAKYGFDITFLEFIRYILKRNENNETINMHFRPMHQICDPCKFKYDYIGYQETFAEDAKYLLSKWRQEFDDFTLKFDDFEKETAIDTARTGVRFLFGAKQFLPDIKIPFVKLMLRTWRDLQIRGYLSKTVDMPYTGDVSSVTQDEFMNAIIKGLEQQQNWTAVKLQRREALVQAYRQVPLDVMERLRQFLLTDCLLFGYNDRPSDLFDRSTPAGVDFLYLDGLS